MVFLYLLFELRTTIHFCVTPTLLVCRRRMGEGVVQMVAQCCGEGEGGETRSWVS